MTPSAVVAQWNPAYTYTETIVSATRVSGATRTPVATAYSTVVGNF